MYKNTTIRRVAIRETGVSRQLFEQLLLNLNGFLKRIRSVISKLHLIDNYQLFLGVVLNIIIILLVNTRELLPSAGFPSPSGGVAPWAPPLGAFGAPVGAPAAHIRETAAFGGGERRC